MVLLRLSRGQRGRRTPRQSGNLQERTPNLIGTSENNGREFQTLAVDPCMWERPSMTELASDSTSEAELGRKRFWKRYDIIGGVNMMS